jgi:archaellum component FlaF (FlaF/FlaG flagellin family)
MKRLITIPLMALAMLPASAQRIVATNTTIDCGRVGFEQPVTATYELRNKGKRRLVIESVRTDCGCTAVDFPKEVAAGDNFTIKMTYDARQLGHFHKMAAIKSNASEQPLYLTMKGVVLAEVLDYAGNYPLSMGTMLLDKTELEFDDVNKGDEVIQEIHVYNNGTDVMQPNLMHLPPYLTAQVVPETISPGHGATITVTLHSEKLRDYGLTQTNVYLGKHLGDKVNADIEVPVSAILLPDLSAFANVNKDQAPQLQISTTDIDFTSFDNKSKKTVDVTLQNTGQSALVISSLQMFTSGLKVTLGSREINPGQSTTLKITGIAADLKNVRKRPRILMITNDPDHSKVVINIKLK